MKKIVFDASVHLGQFNIASNEIRMACKGSQDSISLKGKEDIVAVCTFNENSWIDHVIWALPKEEQDSFYRFMDTFHSLKNIIRVPLLSADAQEAVELSKKLGLEISCALSCVVAIREQAQEIHTLYKSLLQDKVQEYMKQFNITIKTPDGVAEQLDNSEELESLYQETFKLFKKQNLDIMKVISKCGNNLISG